jgi:hypothetical protein
MTSTRELTSHFVRHYLDAIHAQVEEKDGVLSVEFPPGRKRRFGRRRKLSFEESVQAQQTELIEPGSPLLKRMLEDASAFGGLGVAYDEGRPEGTLIYTFQFTLVTSLRKRVAFVNATYGRGYETPFLSEGIPELASQAAPFADPAALDPDEAKRHLKAIMPHVQKAAMQFAGPGLEETRKAFLKGAERVAAYFTNLRQEAFQKEARLRKRLGEIQSKLYFTEDGLREIKLEKEREKITQQLREIKHDNTQEEQRLLEQEQEQLERQRRRYAPKLNVRLIGVTALSHRLAPTAPDKPVETELEEPDPTGERGTE